MKEISRKFKENTPLSIAQLVMIIGALICIVGLAKPFYQDYGGLFDKGGTANLYEVSFRNARFILISSLALIYCVIKRIEIGYIITTLINIYFIRYEIGRGNAEIRRGRLNAGITTGAEVLRMSYMVIIIGLIFYFALRYIAKNDFKTDSILSDFSITKWLKSIGSYFTKANTKEKILLLAGLVFFISVFFTYARFSHNVPAFGFSIIGSFLIMAFAYVLIEGVKKEDGKQVLIAVFGEIVVKILFFTRGMVSQYSPRLRWLLKPRHSPGYTMFMYALIACIVVIIYGMVTNKEKGVK